MLELSSAHLDRCQVQQCSCTFPPSIIAPKSGMNFIDYKLHGL